MRVCDLVEDPEALLNSLAEPAASQWRSLSSEPLGVFNQWDRVEHLLCAAQQQAPNELSLSEALYKLYAYSNQFAKAQVFINWVLHQSSQTCNLPVDPLVASAQHSQQGSLSRAARYYLYALKANAIVALRQGELSRAQALVNQLQLLDPLDQVGGSVVVALVERMSEEEYAEA
jgi:hypothetical protein